MSQPSTTQPGLPPLPPRCLVTGLALDPVDRQGLFDYVVAAALAGRAEGRKRTVGYLNVHVANLAARDELLRRYLNDLCDLVYCDGKGIGWGARVQGLPEPPRMTAADWLPELLQRLARPAAGVPPLRTFVVAGKPGVVERAVEQITASHGPLGPVSVHHGYLDQAVTESLLCQIAEERPDVVLIGMGSPLQERWTLTHRDRIEAPVVWPLGATFDYFAGEQARGPEWLRRIGHEWAARLVADPGRLWRRYVLGNPQFLARAAATRLRGGNR
ncbi:WecB/TagA/CpsF family glycosyltransferase [Botrimarina hoheduenensis]|uniref:Putative N-acetylmannosaminyltransferase n=1 Tax=Botrimarina hoheduenensis TaxID=2528000 RepID=A0A5C5VX31_9BACT|nr:WecB/TagA/CpsF family glycosyltransferase [Botrimarina hoheduenensis]TWT42677.1 putative N-acetylmannosaminyltransferase [Botrimarina hoheduenensis]